LKPSPGSIQSAWYVAMHMTLDNCIVILPINPVGERGDTMDNSATSAPKTQVTFKVVSTMKTFKVNDVLGVNTRKDVKKVSKLLGKLNGEASNVINTYSTKIKGYKANDDVADKAVRESRIDVVADTIRWLDSQDSSVLRKKVEDFHKVVASEKKKLLDEYGSTTIPSDRYRQYLDECQKVSITVWVTQLVVTKTSTAYFDGSSYNEESKLYHATVKTKTVYTATPITEEYMISSGAVNTEEISETYTDNGESKVRKVRICTFPSVSGPGTISNFTKRSSGSVEIAYATNRLGEQILTLRRKS